MLTALDWEFYAMQREHFGTELIARLQDFLGLSQETAYQLSLVFKTYSASLQSFFDP